MPYDNDGNPVPWLTDSAIKFLSKQKIEGLSVFEYGCGTSTLWWISKGADVTSCEHDEDWFMEVSELSKGLSRIVLKELVYGGEYCKALPNENKKYHVIVIDGRDRVNCILNCLGSIHDEGVIILDNSERSKYKDGIKFLIENGFSEKKFCGKGFGGEWCTSFFCKPNNIFF